MKLSKCLWVILTRAKTCYTFFYFAYVVNNYISFWLSIAMSRVLRQMFTKRTELIELEVEMYKKKREMGVCHAIKSFVNTDYMLSA